MPADPRMQRQPILPESKAPFTLRTIREAIPKHCFTRSYEKSFRMLLVDLVCVGVAFLVANTVDSILVESHLARGSWALLGLRVLLWLLYTVYQGITMTGLWVIAHECGHESFVPSKMVNDAVGFVIHTCLMVPYYPWQKSHALHHHYTNNVQKDQVWVPETDESVNRQINEPKSALVNGWELILMSTIGWPLYLLINATGPKTKGFVSHFWSGSEIFNSKEAFKVNISGLAMLSWIYVLYRVALVQGAWWLARNYVSPLIVVFFFLTSITFLQHTDQKVPHFSDKEWNWLRGALCTVDRPINSWMDNKLHHIHSHHVVHHLFSKLPSYHAAEATESLKTVCGDYYLEDKTNFFLALWRNYSNCIALDADDNQDILWWKDLNRVHPEMHVQKDE